MQDLDLKFEGIFHNVGQGLFYSGEITLDRNSFNFIYDCGSIWNNRKTNLKHLKPAIQRYISNIENNDTLNLLVISHLHSDHINGLPILLDKFNQVEVVVLPYLSPIERLIIALNNINSPVWYFDFLAEPATFLLNRNVKKVIFITGNGEGGEPLPPQEGPQPKDGFYLPIEKLPEAKKSNIKEEKETNGNVSYKMSGSVGLTHIRCKQKIIWEFVFFNYKGNLKDEHLNEFEKCIKRFKGDKKITDIIRNKNILKKISEQCYAYLVKQGELKNFNNTSLVLFHRPLNFENLSSYIYTQYFMFQLSLIYIRLLFHPTVQEGTLLLGDIDLNVSLEDMVRFFGRNRLEHTSFSLIPHHGSKHNWNNDVLETTKAPIWVASAGTYNVYGHPSFKVLRDILKQNKTPIWCSENNPFIYWFEVCYKC